MKRILIADDSFYQRKVLTNMVAEMGHQAEAVGSGEELLEYISPAYDCVFLDLLMTGMTGIEVLERLKGMNNVPPVVVITADVQSTRRDECISLGAAAFINKVVSQDELEQALDKILK